MTQKQTFPYFVFLKKLVLCIALVYCGLVLVLYFMQRRFIYVPVKGLPTEITMSGHGIFHDFPVTTQDNLPLRGWMISPQEHSDSVLLFFHGNGGNISHRLEKITPYVQAGYHVLLAEYRGYGDNAGEPTEEGLYQDARAYYEALITLGFKPEHIILHGESLGTGVAVQLASEKTVGALVLETPYARLSDPARKKYPFIPFIEAIMHDTFASEEKIAKMGMPKLFLIAGKDEVLGPETGLALYEKAPEPKTIKTFEQATHNTLYQYGAQADVLRFVSAFRDNTPVSKH